jgi:hypothetical protein
LGSEIMALLCHPKSPAVKAFATGFPLSPHVLDYFFEQLQSRR